MQKLAVQAKTMIQSKEKLIWNIRLIVFSFFDTKSLLTIVPLLSIKDKDSQGEISGKRNIVINLEKILLKGLKINIDDYAQRVLDSIGFQFRTRKGNNEWDLEIKAFSQACQATYPIPKFQERVFVTKIDQTEASLSLCDIRQILSESVTLEETVL